MSAPNEPVDQLAIVALAQCLTRIKKADGYRTDAGLNVITEENFGDIDDDVISLEIIDDDEETDYHGVRRRKGRLLITVAVNLPRNTVESEATRALSRRVLADIRQALSTVDPMNFSPGVTGLEIGGRTMQFRDAGSQYFRPQLRLRLSFAETH